MVPVEMVSVLNEKLEIAKEALKDIRQLEGAIEYKGELRFLVIRLAKEALNKIGDKK